MVLSPQSFPLETGSSLTEDAESLLTESASRLTAPAEVDHAYVAGLPERVRRGELSVITLLKGLETIGIVCYRTVDSESEVVYCCMKTGYEGLERLFLGRIVSEFTGYGIRVVRGSFSGPGADRFTAAAVEIGFRKVVRMSMTYSVTEDLAHTYRPAPGIEIQQWTPAYFEDVCKLMCVAAEDFDRAVYPLFGSIEGARTLLLSILRDRHGIFLPELSLVALIDGEPAGFLLASMIQNGTVLILDIAVESERRRRGIGGKLLQYLISKSAVLSRRQIVLAVTLDNNPAIELYKKTGFRQTSIFDQYVLEIRGK